MNDRLKNFSASVASSVVRYPINANCRDRPSLLPQSVIIKYVLLIVSMGVGVHICIRHAITGIQV